MSRSKKNPYAKELADPKYRQRKEKTKKARLREQEEYEAKQEIQNVETERELEAIILNIEAQIFGHGEEGDL